MEFYFKTPSAIGWRKFSVYFLFFGNLLFVTYIWLSHSTYYIQNPSGGDIYTALGRITGLWAEILLLTQLILIGRIRWFEHLYGFDRLNFVHRWIGYLILILLLAHPLLLVVGSAQANGVSLLYQLEDFLANKANVLYALAALMIFIYIVFLAIFVRKRVRYEVWYFTHLLTYVAIGLALLHQIGTGDFIEGYSLYYWYALNFSVFGLVLLWRFLRPFSRFAYYRFRISNVVKESADTTSIYISGHNMKGFKFQAGQYANLTILARHMWFTHPFSFSSAYNGEFIRFTIKNCGDYTSGIAALQVGTYVIVDGPLGLFIEDRALRPKYFFIAGGIGITPLRSMLESLAQKSKDVVLVYAARTINDLVFKSEIEQIQQTDPSVKVHYIVSTLPPDPAPGFETGFLDKAKIVRLVPDFFDREVFLCGPPPMMKAVVKTLGDLGFHDQFVHYEKFSF